MIALFHWLQAHSVIGAFLMFVAIVVATYWPSRRKEMDRAAAIPLHDER
mgnify:CR=1 FL=1